MNKRVLTIIPGLCTAICTSVRNADDISDYEVISLVHGQYSGIANAVTGKHAKKNCSGTDCTCVIVCFCCEHSGKQNLPCEQIGKSDNPLQICALLAAPEGVSPCI